MTARLVGSPNMTASQFYAEKMLEDELLKSVTEACKRFDLLLHHSRPARAKRRRADRRSASEDVYKTAIQGDAGFVDCVIAGPGGFIFRELKKQHAGLTRDQRLWRDALLPSNRYGIWRPSDWLAGTILRELRELAVRHDGGGA